MKMIYLKWSVSFVVFFRMKVSDDNLFKWDACIEGPAGTPYEKGKFHLELKFPEDYPFVAPNVSFLVYLPMRRVMMHIFLTFISPLLRSHSQRKYTTAMSIW